MADRTRLELATSGVTGRHSNQLNYRSAVAQHFNIKPVNTEAVLPFDSCRKFSPALPLCSVSSPDSVTVNRHCSNRILHNCYCHYQRKSGGL